MIQRNLFWIDDLRHVEVLSQTLMRYHDGERHVDAGFEDLGSGEIMVFPGQISAWEPPRWGDSVPDAAERERIIAAIRSAYARYGMVVADTAEIISTETGTEAIDVWNERRRQ